MTAKRDPFTIDFQCHRCGQTGFSVWEESSLLAADGPHTVLISLSDGFYERIDRKSPHRIELVCHKCETVQRRTPVGE